MKNSLRFLAALAALACASVGFAGDCCKPQKPACCAAEAACCKASAACCKSDEACKAEGAACCKAGKDAEKKPEKK